LKSNKPPASKSLFNSILDSCILLSNAIHGIFLSDKIVNSVTALEILLKKDKEDFGVLSRRIKNFIGKDMFDFYKVGSNIKNRITN
jgi:hypothetical protein